MYAAERNPERNAVADGVASLTYHQWVDRVLATADGLAARGVRHGDRVAIGMRNSTDAATVFFATQALGAVAVPFNFRFKAEGIAQILADAGAVAVVCDDGVLGESALGETTGDLIRVTTSPVASAGWVSLDGLCAGAATTVHGT
ncbi:MAG: AMP-binding protein, partial [Pseudonocardia sp.]|nr:AMP-binding protein [Pseudonocardia sp.]